MLPEGDTQTIKLPNGESILIEGYSFSCIRLFSVAILSLVTCSLALWIFSRRKNWLVEQFYCKCPLSKATRLSVRASNSGEMQTLCWKSVGEKSRDARIFNWRHYRFAWCPTNSKFQRVNYIDEGNLQLSDIHELVSRVDGVHYCSR